MHDTINGAMFKEMLLFGTVSIAQAQQAINDLNVFPVPDGDTGTNMSLTIQTAAQELKKIEPATVDQAASVTASALLRGARGNSGVILSLLFRGISKELKGCKEADGAAFAAALQEYDAAQVVGSKTTGKGNFQTAFRLSDGSLLNISIGKYFTPNGVSLSETGVTPDVELDLSDDDYLALYMGTLEHADDAQLQAAVRLLREKIS